MTNYTAKVYEVLKDETTGDGALILELDGKLSAKAKRELRTIINRGDVTLRERVRTVA